MQKKLVNDLIRRKKRTFYGRDFDALRSDLLEYASTYFPDSIQDFSDASVGGLFLDMAAHVGDVMSFYLDHQFSELDINTAVQTKNIEKLLKTAGIKNRSSSPSIVEVDFYLTVPSVVDINDNIVVDPDVLPTILTGTAIKSNSGIKFELMEDLDFSRQIFDEYIHERFINTDDLDADLNPNSYIIKMTGICVSGETKTKTISAGSFQQFKKITISDTDINEILRVKDTSGNEYYEVEYLSQDVVFRAVQNKSYDYDVVSNNLEILPAPYRFTRELDRSSSLTSMTFGSGNAMTLDTDYIPDPSEFALPMYGKTTMSRQSIDPNNMLSTSTLGMSPYDTNLTIVYRKGGGLNHNVSASSIKTVEKLLIMYNRDSSSYNNFNIKTSLNIINEKAARGGEDKPTINELRFEYKGHQNSQSRIVTKNDLLTRVYTLPTNFGRVFRAGLSNTTSNLFSTQLFIISRDSSGKLTSSSDSLKKNLEIYLNQYRLITDAIDILDAFIINIGIEYEIVTDGIIHKNIIVDNINKKIKLLFDIKKWHIDMPINKTNIEMLINNTEGVISLNYCTLLSKTGTDYSSFAFDIDENTTGKFLVGPPGSIFELKSATDDIAGYVK
jgi:hypothetical protein